MKHIFLTLLITGFAAFLSGQTGKDDVRERLYLQTDKQLYLSGEQIQMKLITVDPQLVPLIFSKIAYAELTGDSIAQIQIKIPVTNGIGKGRMLLPATLPTGTYRLIAYTQYM